MKKISAAAIYLYPKDEYSAEKLDLDAIGGLEEQILCEDNYSCVPTNDSDVNSDIEAHC